MSVLEAVVGEPSASSDLKTWSEMVAGGLIGTFAAGLLFAESTTLAGFAVGFAPAAAAAVAFLVAFQAALELDAKEGRR